MTEFCARESEYKNKFWKGRKQDRVSRISSVENQTEGECEELEINSLVRLKNVLEWSFKPYSPRLAEKK